MLQFLFPVDSPIYEHVEEMLLLMIKKIKRMEKEASETRKAEQKYAISQG